MGQLENVTFFPGMAQPQKIFAVTHALLMPSLIDEAAGRLAAEALINGIPALVSDSGGLPETTGTGGQIVEFKRDQRGEPIIDADTVERWTVAVRAMADDQNYSVAAEAARLAGQRYQTQYQQDLYANWFSKIP